MAIDLGKQGEECHNCPVTPGEVLGIRARIARSFRTELDKFDIQSVIDEVISCHSPTKREFFDRAGASLSVACDLIQDWIIGDIQHSRPLMRYAGETIYTTGKASEETKRAAEIEIKGTGYTLKHLFTSMEAEYQYTQSILSGADIRVLTAYRGVYGDNASLIRDNKRNGRETEIFTHHAQSWSLSQLVARDFAGVIHSGIKRDYVILRHTFHAEEILTSSLTNGSFAGTHESEIVVIGPAVVSVAPEDVLL